MDNKKKSLILTLAIVAIFIVATVAYNALKEDAPSTGFIPNVKTENADKIVAKTNEDTISTPANTSTNSSSDSASVEDTSTQADTPANSDSSEDQASSDGEDEKAIMPDIPVKMIDGSESTFWGVVPKGKPVVINLFASWCPPCKSEMPEFVEAREEYKGDVTFIFFDSFDGQRETEETLNDFVDEYFIDDDTLIVLDPGYLSYVFGTNSIPVTILLNEDGEIANGFTGSISKTTLTNAVDALLN